MKLRNNYNMGDRILILHANTKNPLRKDDIGKIGTILDKRCSFCIVRLDGDDRDKNYNYGTFGKIVQVDFSPYEDYPGDFTNLTLEEVLQYINHHCTTPTISNAVYKENKWNSIVYDEDKEFGIIYFTIDNRLNDKSYKE